MLCTGAGSSSGKVTAGSCQAECNFQGQCLPGCCQALQASFVDSIFFCDLNECFVVNGLLHVIQELAAAEAKAQQGLAKLGPITKGCAYQAWMGFYNSYKKFLRWTPEQLVQQANHFSRTLGELLKYSSFTLSGHLLQGHFGSEDMSSVNQLLHDRNTSEQWVRIA